MELSNTLHKHYFDSFDKILITEEARNSQAANNFTQLFPSLVEYVNGDSLKLASGEMTASEFNQSKRLLLIKPFKGKFFKQCPGHNSVSACCNYFVINLGSQCHFNCSYCYLQSFLNTPYLVVYSNIEDAFLELSEVAKNSKGKSIRIGTGEVIDSLGLDPITRYSERLASALDGFPNITLELKTKSNFVDHLIKLPLKANVSVSWSINPQHIIEQEEHGTASLAGRLDAALKCRDAGFKIGFHIDPLIWHPEWENNYESLVDEIVKRFNPNDIPYLSMGALRFQKEQRHMMKERFNRGSYVNGAELFPSKDGKLRYDKSLRTEMFKFILRRFKSHSSDWNIFMCMESPETWLSAYESFPRKVEGISELFEPRSLG